MFNIRSTLPWLAALGLAFTLALHAPAQAEMDGHRVATDPDPYAPYLLSQAIKVGDLVYVSGQAALSMDGQLVGVGDFDAQAKQTFENLAAVLEAGGSSMDRVVKVTIYLTDMSNFGKIVDLRKKYFSKPYPADTIVEVTALALPELEIEIEAIGLIGGKLHDID